MIRKILCLFALTLSTQASSVPSEQETEFNTRFIFRAFYKISPELNSIFEYDYSSESDNRKEKEFKLGARYRLHRNFKLGFFYKNAKGQRHDDDWVWENSSWFWRDSNNRSEDIFILEGSYRNLFLNSSNTLFEVRLSAEVNTYNSQNSIKFRPGITHFINTSINLYAFYEAYIPLNYSETTIYEHWLYTGFLYHYNRTFKPGLFYNYKTGVWTSSKDFKERNPSSSYEVKHSNHYIGMNLNFYF